MSLILGDGYVTAAFSFGAGFVILVIAMLLNRRGRQGLVKIRGEIKSGHLPPWALFGGAFGAFFVLSQGLITPVLGLALFTVGIVAGLVLGGLVIDRIGIGPGGRLDPSLTRVIGTVLAVGAVAISMVSDVVSPEGQTPPLWLAVMPVLVGMGSALQSATNGLLRSAAHSALSATFINFAVGTAILLVAAAISVSVQGWPTQWPTEFWYYLAGPAGIVFIALAAILVRTAGVLLLSMSNVAGQLIASVVFDAAAPLAGGLTPWLVVGAAIALLAVLIAALPRRAERSQ